MSCVFVEVDGVAAEWSWEPCPYMPSIPRDLVACSKYVTLLPSLSSGEWSQRMPGDCQIGLLVCMPAHGGILPHKAKRAIIGHKI